MTTDTKRQRDKEIRAFFSRFHEPKAMEDFARLCREAGIITQHELEDAGVRLSLAICRKALSAHDATGMPFAGPLSHGDDDEGGTWGQRAFWHPDDYRANLDSRCKQTDGDVRTIVLLKQELYTRHGEDYPLPAWLDVRGMD